MKPNALMDVTVSGNMTGEIIPMDFDPEATAHLTSVLTNLYSNRLLACIREYSTNAYDANVEAGRATTPIEVTTPNFASPYLIIKDNGPGMGIDKIRSTYSKYGASTKRGSNDFNGMLGVGSKAALTYTPNFTVISVHDGVRYTVSVSLNDEGLGEMQVVDTSKTDAEPGVTVQIPIKRSDNSEVLRTAQRFFSFWPEGTVLLNGTAPARVGLKHVVGNIYTFTDQYAYDQDVIVMGNVAYPVPGDRGLVEGMPHYAYFAEIGEVNFSPSRESLRHDARAKQVIARILKDYKDNFKVALQREIDEQPNPASALVMARILNAKYDGMNFAFTYQGTLIPEHFPKDEDFHFYAGERSTVENTAERFLGRHLGRGYYLQRGTPEGFLRDAVIVTGVPKVMSPYARTKLRSVAESQFSVTIGKYYLTERTTINSYWLNGVKRLTWDEVNKTFNARKAKSTSDPTIYEMYDKAGNYEKRRTQPGEKYLFVSPADYNRWGFSQMAEFWVGRLGYDYLVSLSVNRHNKFKREHTARAFGVAAREYSDNWVKSIPEARRLSMAIGFRNSSNIKDFKKYEAEILDPETRGILAKYDPALDLPFHQEYARLESSGFAPNLTHTDKGVRIFSGMPTLGHYGGPGVKQTVEIYNALYVYRKDKKNVG